MRPDRRIAIRAALSAIRYSLFAIRYSLFAIRYSLFAIRYSLFAIRYSLFAIRYSLFAIRYSLFAIRSNPRTRRHGRVCQPRTLHPAAQDGPGGPAVQGPGRGHRVRPA